MSYQRGWDAIHLRMPDTIPHTEYCSHPRLVEEVVGVDPREDPTAWRLFYDATNYDLLWSTDDGPGWEGPTTNMGHAVFQEGGTDYDADVSCPFGDVDEVLAFRPDEVYGVPNVDERAAYFQARWQAAQEAYPNQVYTGGYYKTVFSACIAAFGWDLFLTAGGIDPKAFDRVLEGFFRISEANYAAWAKTTAPVFICHDDIVWTSGPVFRPEWYRQYVFPRYERLWDILKSAGKKVLFCSDGDFTPFVHDLAAAGADGFIFEPLTDLELIVRSYGESKVIIGNVDTRALTFGGPDAVRAEVERCWELGRRCPGYFFAVGNHIPHNVPIENALLYLQLIEDYGSRRF